MQAWARAHLGLGDLAFALVFVVGAIVRFYRIGGVNFAQDAGGVYMLANTGLSAPGLPVTSIVASIGSWVQPLSVYLYALPAALGDPIFGAYFTAALSMLTLLLMYVYARRYFGRIAGVCGTVYVAVALNPVNNSRQIWPPDLFGPFVVAFLLLLSAVVTGKKRQGWLGWALVLYVILLQLHPVALPLGVLIVLTWMLAPGSVKRRDVVLGCVGAAVLTIPTILWELSSNLWDLHAYYAYLRRGSVTNLDAIKVFLQIGALPGGYISWSTDTLWHVLNAISIALPTIGLAYLLMWVAVQALMNPGLRTPGSPRARAQAWLEHARAPEMRRFRVALLLALWPALVLASQIHHNSDIGIQYMILIYPAVSLSVGVLAQDCWRAAGMLSARVTAIRYPIAVPVRYPAVAHAQPTPPRVLEASAHLRGKPLPAAYARDTSSHGYSPLPEDPRPWLVRLGAGLVTLALLLALIVVGAAQVISSPTFYPSTDWLPVRAADAGMAQARQLVRQDHIGLVVFVPDFFSLDAVNYLVNRQARLDVPTQIVQDGGCLVGPAENQPVLYLMSGVASVQEAYLQSLPGVHDLFANTDAHAYFRAYVVAPDELTAGTRVTWQSAPSSPVAFADDLQLTQVRTRTTTDGTTRADLIVGAEVETTRATTPSSEWYVMHAAATDMAHTTESDWCSVAPMIARQPMLFLIQGGMADAVAIRVTVTRLSQDRFSPRVGPLRLVTPFDLATTHLLMPMYVSAVLPTSACGGLECDAGGVIVPLAPGTQ